MACSTEETLALKTLLGGVLRLERGAWWIVADDHAREVPTRLVQGLRDEGLLEPIGARVGRGAPPELWLTGRGRRVAETAVTDPDAFVFLQDRADVAALPLSPAVASRGLIPREGTPYRVLPKGFTPTSVDALGARGCPDWGVDDFADAVQWFGGFGEADPLITTPRIPGERIEAMLREAEAVAAERA